MAARREYRKRVYSFLSVFECFLSNSNEQISTNFALFAQRFPNVVDIDVFVAF